MTTPDTKGIETTGASHEQKAEAIRPPGAGELTYNNYLKVEELKQLQICQSNPPHHDEPLFIIIHQSYELWFKLILHEIDEVFLQLARDRVRRASFYMGRVVSIMKLLTHQIHILETMTPRDFLGFRYNLSPASGFGSSQFREIEFAAGAKHAALLEHFREDPGYPAVKRRYEEPSLGESFYALLRRQGFNLPEGKPGMTESELTGRQDERILELLKLYLDDENFGDLHDFAETLMDLDEQILLWRAHHVTVVERMIGFKKGTGGSEGVGYLQSTLSKRCFPDLWKLRTFLEKPERDVSEQRDRNAAATDSTTGGAGSGSGCPFHSG